MCWQADGEIGCNEADRSGIFQIQILAYLLHPSQAGQLSRLPFLAKPQRRLIRG
jgi:hypothetical protein